MNQVDGDQLLDFEIILPNEVSILSRHKRLRLKVGFNPVLARIVYTSPAETGEYRFRVHTDHMVSLEDADGTPSSISEVCDHHASVMLGLL